MDCFGGTFRLTLRLGGSSSETMSLSSSSGSSSSTSSIFGSIMVPFLSYRVS